MPLKGGCSAYRAIRGHCSARQRSANTMIPSSRSKGSTNSTGFRPRGLPVSVEFSATNSVLRVQLSKFSVARWSRVADSGAVAPALMSDGATGVDGLSIGESHGRGARGATRPRWGET